MNTSAQPPLEEERFDAIVIGSGIGGLGAAALLALEAEQRVLVLERHDVPGGFTHTFSRNGWEWDVGLHYVGGVTNERSAVRRIFDRITDGRLQWEPVGDVYDTVRIAGRSFEFAAGRKQWLQRMTAAFPGARAALETYLDLVTRTVSASRSYFGSKALPPAADLVAGWAMRRRFRAFSDRTVAQVLDDITGDPLLRGVLTAQYGDYGLTPARASWAIHAMVVGHYLEGAGYPAGGGAAIANTIIPTITAAGGRVVTRAEVEQVLVESGRTTGVRLSDGRELRAPIVISDTGAAITAHTLLPEGAPGRMELLETVERIGPSSGHACLHVGLDATAEQLGLGRSNLWVYPEPDHDAAIEIYRHDPSAPLPLAFISFPSAKDPTFTARHPGKATVAVIGWVPFAWFEPWRNTSWKRRGEEYAAFKKELAARYMEVLEENVPQVKGHVAFADLSTPLTTRSFCNYEHGEIYGLDHTPERFRERALRPHTPLRGFYLTGADVCTAGIAGALFGAVLTASSILGHNVLKTSVREHRS